MVFLRWHMSCKPFDSFSYCQYFLSQQPLDRPICSHLSNCLVFWSICVDSCCKSLPLSNFSFVCSTCSETRENYFIKKISSRSDFQISLLGPSFLILYIIFWCFTNRHVDHMQSTDAEVKVCTKMKISWKFTHSQAIKDMDEIVSWSEQIWRNCINAH